MNMFDALDQIAEAACKDAQEHGLWECIANQNDVNERHHCACRIRDEAEEVMLACSDRAEYCEELADVVIMALSTAAYLGIDIGREVQRKMEINHWRPWKHGKEERE